MKIELGDTIEAFSKGSTVTGYVTGIANERIALNTGGIQNIGINKEEILTVNGKAFTDKPCEVYVKEPAESESLGKQFSEGFQKLIDQYDDTGRNEEEGQPE